MIVIRRLSLSTVVTLLMITAFARGAFGIELTEVRPHLTFNVGSYHHNAIQDFNEINPGIGAGLTFAIANPDIEIDFEVGQYKNSLSEQSVYVMSSLDAEVWEVSENLSLRMGGFMGFAHYPGERNKFEGRGVPTIGNWVMGAGAQVTLRVQDNTDLRMRIMPAGDVADVLLTMQVARYF